MNPCLNQAKTMTARQVLLLGVVQLGMLNAAAQSNSGIIKGRLQDSLEKKSLPLATVTVFRAIDTSMITYRLSDQSGNFKVPGIPVNLRCRILISFSGYKTYRKEFELTKE